MKRAAGKKTWIKLYPLQCLQGSIRWQLDAAERGVWYDLLNLAAVMPNPGVISDSDMRPVPHTFIAHQLNINVDLLETTLNKCKIEGRISENDTGIHIVNWAIYQSEYQRQEVSRQAKKQKLEISPTPFEEELIIILKQLPCFGQDKPASILKLREILSDYPRLDHKRELKKFVEYWGTERRKLKKPWLALRNWLDKAEERKDGKAKHSRELPKAYTPPPDYGDD